MGRASSAVGMAVAALLAAGCAGAVEAPAQSAGASSPTVTPAQDLSDRVVAALPQGESAHGLRIETSCRALDEACVEYVGLGVSAVSDFQTDPAHFRIAIYPSSGSGVDPEQAF